MSQDPFESLLQDVDGLPNDRAVQALISQLRLLEAAIRMLPQTESYEVCERSGQVRLPYLDTIGVSTLAEKFHPEILPTLKNIYFHTQTARNRATAAHLKGNAENAIVVLGELYDRLEPHLKDLGLAAIHVSKLLSDAVPDKTAEKLILASSDIRERYDLTAKQIRDWSKDPRKPFIKPVPNQRKYELTPDHPELIAIKK